jgi:hypothetical protein
MRPTQPAFFAGLFAFLLSSPTRLLIADSNIGSGPIVEIVTELTSLHDRASLITIHFRQFPDI